MFSVILLFTLIVRFEYLIFYDVLILYDHFKTHIFLIQVPVSSDEPALARTLGIHYRLSWIHLYHWQRNGHLHIYVNEGRLI